MADDLISLQVAPEAPLNTAASTATNMLIAPTSMAARLRHFPEEIYDLSPESHLSRFLKVLLGDAGIGQVRKHLMMARLRSTLQGSHFFDLDKFYGPLFGIKRTIEETLGFDPHTETATTAQWDDAMARDASFRSRIEQLAKGISYGPTPTGMELIAEAILSVDCDVYESFIQADGSYQTYAELETLYATNGSYAEMEGKPYSELEGASLNRLSGDERRVFTVRPKRAITQREAYDLRRVLDRIKPADCRFVIDFEGVPVHIEETINEAVADSEHWEIISEIAAVDSAAYQAVSEDPVEQPRPAFSGYQGEAWSYNADLAGVTAYTDDLGIVKMIPTARVTYSNSTTRDFPADQAVLPRRAVQAGRVASDAILVTNPYPSPPGVSPIYEDAYLVSSSTGPATLYADGVPLENLVDLLARQEGNDPFQQNPENRYWVSTDRFHLDGVEDVLEVRLSEQRLLNYLTFEVAHFPHRLIAEVYTENAEWVEVYRHVLTDSIPKIIHEGPEVTQRAGHPHHTGPNHWYRVGHRHDRLTGSRIRLRMTREVTAGIPPYVKVRDAQGNLSLAESSYTMAVRSLDLGYRVTDRADFTDLSEESGGVISATRDIAGSLVQFRAHELPASNVLDGESTYWRSEPQPVNYAVVNLYLDTRQPGNGDGTVIDRWYLDPTHPGPHLSIYYSNDPQASDGTDAFYEARTWTPIPRDYALQKGYVHVPTTRARYWKFEFTNLSAEPYESFLPISRRVRLFPQALVELMHRDYLKTSGDVPSDLLSAIDTVREVRYADALDILTGDTPATRSDLYLATEALYFPSLNRQDRANNASWVFGFTPWHQDERAPRFYMIGKHAYEMAEVRHTSKMAFFVGLKEISAYRTDWEANDDTQVYYETFEDFRNLEQGFTWNFEPGYMRTGTTPGPTVQATSRTYASRNNISALQFATVQSPPTQLVPDHDFRDPAKATSTWDDLDNGHIRVGDATLIYSTNDHSVVNVRHVVPEPKPVDNPLTRTLVQPDIHPVFGTRSYDIPDEQEAAATEGGIATPLVGLSPEGRAYAAVRVTAISSLTSPLYLQIVRDSDGAVLVEKPVTAQRGETVEVYVTLDIPIAELGVRARLIQRGKSNDAWKIHTLAIFDDGIVWEFSVNGGSDWQTATGIRNNDAGILTFFDPGNQLKYRVRATRPNQWVSAIKIRPWYVGAKNARSTGNHRGPNVSVYDADVPIDEDPLFTTWREPIPAWWFQRGQSFPILPVEGAPNVTEYARFYGRPANVTVPTPTDSISVKILRVRAENERLDLLAPIEDSADRILFAKRSATVTVPSLADAAVGDPMFGIPNPVHNSIVNPVFSRTRY